VSLSPRTVYAIACDAPRCFETFHLEVGGETYELQLQSLAAAEGWDEPLRERGWAVTNRHLCPACVRRQAEQLTGGAR
jgi:hypothetical protein